MRLLPPHFYSGLSGLAMPGPRATYPPAFQNRSRLQYYAYLFNSLEVNSSFYKTPQAATVEKWAAAVPDDFMFTFKLSKTVTHIKNLDFNEDDIESFMHTVQHIGNKKGCLLIQFPPSLTIDKLDKVQSLLSTVSWFNEEQWQAAVEFRHVSWYEKEVEEILKEYNAIQVLHDKPGCAPPGYTGDAATVYMRLHGPKGNYRGSYDDDFLKQYATNIRHMLSKGKTVYCYFNNTMGDAFKNLERLNLMMNDEL